MNHTAEHREMPWRLFQHKVYLKSWATLFLYFFPVNILKAVILCRSNSIFGFSYKDKTASDKGKSAIFDNVLKNYIKFGTLN